MIAIRTVRSKYKGIRVDISRLFRHVDPKTQKVRFSTKQIGSFKLSAEKNYPNELSAVLELDEILQLKNWLAEVKFAELFNEEADELTKFTVHMPQKLYDAYIALSHEAQNFDMSFIPNQVILEALLHKAKLVEQKINKMSSKRCQILEGIGIETDKLMTNEAYQRLLDTESRALFKALIDLKQPISKTCSELEAIAKKYGKEKERISPMQVKEWAGLIPGRNLKKVNRWSFAAAIELLLSHGKDPLLIAPPERVTEYWVGQNYQHFTLIQAKKEFTKLFKPADKSKTTLFKIIETHYKNI
jgi:hypothetical protein